MIARDWLLRKLVEPLPVLGVFRIMSVISSLMLLLLYIRRILQFVIVVYKISHDRPKHWLLTHLQRK